MSKKSRVKMVVHWSVMAFLFQIIMIFHQLGHACAQDSVSTSNGRDFYIGYIRNFGGTSFTTLRLWIGTTSTENIEYVIESRGEIIQQETVNSTSPTTVAIDANFQVTDSSFENREKGLHIYITTDTGSIYVIAENSVSPFNQGVFLAYPCLTFNEDEYEYYVISTEVVSTPQSQLLLVGCENDTKISITPSQPITLPRDLQSSNTSDSISIKAENVHNGTIHQLQTILISSNGDLTGTRIVSSKPLSVIAGHECGNVPSHTTGCEPFAVQVPPSFTWGNTFLLASFGGRDADTVFKFVSTVPTNVVIACEQTLGFSNVMRFQFAVSASTYCFLRSSKPILLVQLATSGSGDGRGDPAIALVSPVDQYVHNISFLAPPANTFSGVYISVTVSAEYYSSDSIFYDGEVLDCTWNEIYDDNSTVVGYGCNYTITNLRTGLPSQHVVSHLEPNGLISVLVYAFSTSNIGLAYLAGQEITAGFIGNDGNIVINPQPKGDFVEFYDITEFPGVAELDNDVLDGASEAIIIPNGLWFGQEFVKEAFVNENGVISFDKPWGFSYPDRFPTDYYWTQLGKAIAPFWSDNDIRKEGHVRYATYCNITDTTGCSYHAEGQAILDEVNLFIQANRGADTDFFAGDWMLIAQWDHVHPYPHGSDDTQDIPEETLSKTNTYQAIVVSDTIHTSMVFTYICGDLQWSAFGSGRNAAVVGYNSAGDRYFNHRLSGYTSIGDSLSCAVRLGKRRKRQSGVRSTSMDVQNTIAECSSMQEFDKSIYISFDISNYVSMLEPCPCEKSQADLDTARFRPQNDNINCYVSMKPLFTPPHVLKSTSDSIVQQCCYNDNGALITTKSGDAGSLLFQHPIREQTKYEKLRDRDSEDVTFGDKTFKMTCCTGNVNGKDFCTNFFGRRPNNNCSGYIPPVVGTGWGDPHYTTFGGLKFDFQGIGDFTVFETSPPSITIQGRMERIDDYTATWHTGLAFGDTDQSFEVTGTNDGWRIVESNNEITDQLPPVSRWPDDDTTLVQLRRDKNNKLTADFFTSGISLIIYLNLYNNRNYFSYNVKVPTSYMSSTVQGLLGNFGSELFTIENQPIPYSSDQGVYCAMTLWMVTESLLFRHAYGPVPDNGCARRKRRQAPNVYTPTFFDNLNFTDAQRMLCENNRQCLYDLFITQDNDVAQTTLDTEKETNMTIATLNNFPPKISAEATLRVNLGEESVLTLSLVDSEDNFTLSVQDGLPDSPMLEKISDGEYFFMWTLQQVTNKTLVFIANDTRGAASLFIPTVEICACVNEGVCTLDGLLTSNTTVVMNCLCSEAYDGRFCQEDRNGCSEIQCFEGVECRDIPAPGVGAVCGDCPLGYTGDSLKCYDIDECFLDANLCEQVCTNTDGGFVCSCMEGYQLMANQCKDVNECRTINDCQQLCLNTEGSYTCSCNEEFSLSTDGRNCIADFPCNGSCSFACAVIDGLEQCYCQNGFQLDIVNGTQCIDRDECQESNLCEYMCTNNEGSFSCSCRPGYQLLSDGKRCEDINECFQAAFISTDLCESDPNSQCINTKGSFECTCAAGYNNLTINGSCQRVKNEPPPIVDVIIDETSIENSVNFTSSTLTPDTFTPARQQLFRETTAIAVNTYCNSVSCKLILPSGEIQKVTQLVIFSANVAIPISLIKKKDGGDVMFIVYIRVDEAYLSKDDLEYAIMNAAELYEINGFLPIFELTLSTPTVRSGAALIGVIVGVIAVPIVLVTLILLAVLCKKCCFNKRKSKKSLSELRAFVENPFGDAYHEVDKDDH